ncbi:MAG TPA: type 1 glutamine amidotransferase domain-containing protein [Nevskiaceae bacterium]|nr:type 1 glutamine amidotransferase domain-containing protein [Nevskiaceae bacterium]
MILILLPASDYDPTESSVPWMAMQAAGIECRFATPTGAPAFADERLVKLGFGPLDKFFMTRKPDLATYHAMAESAAFRSPLAYADVRPDDFEGVLVPGGHAPGMKSMLESPVAQSIAAHFFVADKPVAAVCHGVLLLARAKDPRTGRSVLHGRRTTALTATNMELAAWLVTAPFLGRYYRTYPQTVEAEVRAALASPADFDRGPVLPKRDTSANPNGFVVRDRNYLSARWPGDCHRFARELVALVQSTRAAVKRRAA